MKTIIHVNQHKIKLNRKTGSNDPVLTVKTYKSNTYAHSVSIKDASGNEVAKVVYSPDKPLSCGATVWIESECKVVVDGHEETREERRDRRLAAFDALGEYKMLEKATQDALEEEARVEQYQRLALDGHEVSRKDRSQALHDRVNELIQEFHPPDEEDGELELWALEHGFGNIGKLNPNPRRLQ
jgi:hypothetical protein